MRDENKSYHLNWNNATPFTHLIKKFTGSFTHSKEVFCQMLVHLGADASLYLLVYIFVDGVYIFVDLSSLNLSDIFYYSGYIG